MKLPVMIACCLLCAFTAPAAWADNECQITLSSPDVSFGQLKQSDIVSSQQGWNQMPSRDMSINVYCQESQNMALFVQAAAGEKGLFYFGDSSGLAERVSKMIVDGKNYAIARTVDRVNFTPDGDTRESLLLRNNNGIIAIDNNQPVSGKQMNVTLTLTPVLNDQRFTHTSDTTSLESNMMWEVLTK